MSGGAGYRASSAPSGKDEAGLRAAAAQAGEHLHIAFDGGDLGLNPAGAGLYRAWTTLAVLEGIDLLA